MSKSATIWTIVIVIIIAIILIWWYFAAMSQPNNVTTMTPNSEKVINAFSFAALNPPVNGTIDNNNYVVNLAVPTGTDLTTLVPTIAISDNATISPASGATQDFTNPVNYTVTAQDGSTQNYTVTVIATNPTDSITSFSFGLTGEMDSVKPKTINVIVPAGTDVTNLSPAVTLSQNATVSPTSGTAEDFTSPVSYTVTAQNGTTMQKYTVTVTVSPATSAQ